MIFWVLFVAGLAVFGSRFHREGLYAGYISKDSTDAVRGIFILLILASHFSQYVPEYTAPIDVLYRKVYTMLEQLVVCMFLFYSGYGVMLSLREKGETYRKDFPRKRILRTLLVYDLSQLIFLLLQGQAAKTFSLKDYLLALFAWQSFGNDNWYIFVILGCYCITWLAVMGSRREEQTMVFLSLGVLAFMGLLICAGRQKLWYSTIICYPLGAAYYYARPRVEKFLESPKRYYPSLLILTAVFLAVRKSWYAHLALYELTAALFAVLVVLVTMKLEIKNRLLRLAGRHLQELFLVHRAPMILLGKVPYIKERRYLYFLLSVLGAIAAAYLFGLLVDLLFRKKPKTA